MDDLDGQDETLFPKTAGERLRAARQAQRLDLADIAQRTRVPIRHLQAIEDGDYSGLPTPTYAIGFARSYARAVGEDEVAIAREVRGRAEVGTPRKPEYVPYATDEPARTPSGGVMLAGIALAVLIAILAGLWYGTDLFRGGSADTPAAATNDGFVPATVDAAPAAAPTPAAAQVTLVAKGEVWVRVYDAANTTLLQRTLAPGERFDVPPTANNPMINTGRPDQLDVLLNGSAIPPLGNGRVAVKDVPIGAAALQARAQGNSAPAAAPTTASAAPAPAATPPPTPSASRSIPAAFRDAAPAAPSRSRPAAAENSTGQRDNPPDPAAVPADNAAAPR